MLRVVLRDGASGALEHIRGKHGHVGVLDTSQVVGTEEDRVLQNELACCPSRTFECKWDGSVGTGNLQNGQLVKWEGMLTPPLLSESVRPYISALG
jgi:hypothetical protein